MEIGVQTSTSISPRKRPALGSVSPSQLDAYRRCPRVWFNQQILQDREPSKPFLLRGTAIHKALEIYLQTGEVLPTVSLPDPLKNNEPTVFQTLEFVQVAIPHIPKPITDKGYWSQYPTETTAEGKTMPTAMLMLEQPGELSTFEGGPGVNQYIDVVEALPKTCRILDYKTTSDFRYSKTPAELEENTQLCWNAKYIFAISDYDEIEIEHLYLKTSGRPKAKPVTTRVTRAQVEKIWQRDMAVVREMMAWAELGKGPADRLPPNTESCDMYGGCFYRKKCGFDVATVGWKQRIEPMSETQTNGILAQLLNEALRSDNKSKVAQDTKAALKSGNQTDLMAILGAAAPPAPSPSMVDAVPLFAGATAAAASLRESLAAKPLGITPPDAPPNTSTPEEVEAATADAAAKEKEEETKDDVIVEEEPPALARKRGRPKKAAETAVDPILVQKAEPDLQAKSPFPPVTTIPGLDTTKTNEDAVPRPSPPADIRNNAELLRKLLMTPDPAFECGCEVLFIDTLPSKGWEGEQPVDLANMMHAIEEQAARSADKPDYRMIEYTSKAYLAQSIRVMMRGLPKSVFMDSRIPGADVFLSVVTPYCKYIFKGVR